tara:strand:+ start:84 stop:521 length:438 start_codon:yes stop_codon:yes gene_type:complete
MGNNIGSVAEARVPESIADLLPPVDEDIAADKALLAKLIGRDGKLKVDLSLPKQYELEAAAEQLVNCLTGYQQASVGWRSARNSGDNAKAQKIFTEMNYQQLTAAIIQAEHPGVKKIADDIAVFRVADVKRARKARQPQQEEASR